MSKKEYQFIKPLAKKPTLKPKTKIQTKTKIAVEEFIASGLEYAEVPSEISKSGTRGLLIGLGRAIGKERKDQYEARLTTDNKVVLIKKK